MAIQSPLKVMLLVGKEKMRVRVAFMIVLLALPWKSVALCVNEKGKKKRKNRMKNRTKREKNKNVKNLHTCKHENSEGGGACVCAFELEWASV